METQQAIRGHIRGAGQVFHCHIWGSNRHEEEGFFFLPYSVVDDRESHQEKKVMLNYLHYF